MFSILNVLLLKGTVNFDTVHLDATLRTVPASRPLFVRFVVEYNAHETQKALLHTKSCVNVLDFRS